MNKGLHGALIVLAALCLCAAIPAHGQSNGSDEEMAEQRFHVQMLGALNNDPKSQYNVAQMYERGVGIPQDLGMAHMWYTKSANQGYDPAIKKLKNWVSEDQAAQKEAELRARQRAEEQKRREAEAKTKAATEAKAARIAAEQKRRQAARQQRAEEQKRREAEAKTKAAAEAKAARIAAEQKRRQAARQQRAEEQKRREAEAKTKAAAEAKAARIAAEQQHHEAESKAATAKTPLIAETRTEVKVKDKPIKADKPATKHQSTGEKSADKTPVFRANPCDTPTAKFTSTCQ